MELLPVVIGAVTNDFLTNESNSTFLNFAKLIDKPDNYYAYLNVIDNVPVLHIVIADEDVISMPLSILYESCPEFINYYNVASFDGIYNTEALTAFAIYFILKSYLDKEDGTDEKESMEKFSEEKLKDFAAKHADKFSENQVTEKSDSKKDSEQSEQ